MNAMPLFDLIAPPVTKRRAIASQPISPARRSDPDTAKEAANANQEIRGTQRVKVFQYLVSCGARGATDYEVSEALGILRTSAGKRRKEIQELGHVEDSGMRRKTDSQQSAIVWRAKAP